MSLRANHNQSAKLYDTFTKLNVRTTTSDVCCKCNCTFFSSLCDNRRLALIVLRIQKFIRNILFIKIRRNHLIFCNRCRADKYRTANFVVLLDCFCNSLKLSLLRLEYKILFVFTSNRTIRWNLNNIKAIDLLELFGFSEGCTRHTRKLVVQAEIVLERYSCERHTLLKHWNILFCLNRLMKTFVVATTLHQTARVFVDDNHFTIVCYYVIFVTLKERLRF